VFRSHKDLPGFAGDSAKPQELQARAEKILLSGVFAGFSPAGQIVLTKRSAVNRIDIPSALLMQPKKILEAL